MKQVFMTEKEYKLFVQWIKEGRRLSKVSLDSVVMFRVTKNSYNNFVIDFDDTEANLRTTKPLSVIRELTHWLMKHNTNMRVSK